jgi:hypothetical protein
MPLRARRRIVPAVFLVILAGCQSTSSPPQSDAAGVRVFPRDIGGTVTSAKGPEAGVWVIAETSELPTKYARIVVTDDRGRYLLPDLPKASYSVWVRGYGLVDSAKVRAEPGARLDLKAVVAPDAASAAQYYPAIHWYAMLGVPAAGEFAGGPGGKGLRGSQNEWLDNLKTDGCYTCHQIGNPATRTIPKELGQFQTSKAAWLRRIQSGQAGQNMIRNIGRSDADRMLDLFADWTDRIANGELPATQPERPRGVERNVVVTLWDWSRPTAYLHDEIATDKRNPTVNAFGPLYGAPELSTDYIPVLDPIRHTATEIKMPMRDPKTPSTVDDPMPAGSPYWGDTRIWDSQANVHNPMFDGQGRVWFTSRVRPPENPPFCKKGSAHPSAKAFPTERANRHLSVLDPKTGKVRLISTCFTTHHLYFAEDANNTLWASSGGSGNEVLGWLNTKRYDETGDEAASQGWTAFVLDTNGNGKRDDYVGPDDVIDPAKDKRIAAGFYGLAPSPVDGSIWGSVLGYPGYLIRVVPGANPSETALTEIFEPPLPGYSPRGMDIDRNGVVWAPLASGHFASFDRRKCKAPLNGPQATGKHCPEGWTLHAFPGPQFAGVASSGSAEASYYAWVDQFNTLGLGANVPIATGNANEAMLALVDGKFVALRVPYPMGFFAKGMDGRTDDPKAGWKGRGLWSTYATRAPFHIEGGKGTRPKVVHFQIRPDPLAN